MLTMTVVLNLSIPFLPWRWPARWTLLVAATTPLLAQLLIVWFGRGVPPGFGHLLTWTPLAVYCAWSFVARLRGRVPLPPLKQGSGLWPALVNVGRRRWFETVFRVWLGLLVAILLVSLVFDARTAIQWLG
jgi:hypothetical protein